MGKLFVATCTLALAIGCSGDKDMKKAEPKPARKTVTPTPTPPPKEVPPAEFAKIVTDCWAAFDAKDEAKFAACYGPKSVYTMVDFAPAATATGAQAIVAAMKPYWTAFPDINHDLQLVLVNGNNAVVVVLAKGTHTGDMMGIPPTNKKIGFLSAQAVSHTGGVVTTDAHWVDQGTMMGQLGLNPMPHPEAIESLAAEPTVVIADGGETEQANLAVAKAHGEAFSAHEVDKVIEHYADDAVFKYVAEKDEIKGKDGVKKALSDYYAMSSDVKGKQSWQWAAGDYVVMRGTSEGTHDGDMGELKKTGKPFKMDELHILKLADGKIVEHWIFANSLAFATQLGLVDPTKMGPPK